MRIPTIAVPFRFFQGGQVVDQHEASSRLTNYPILSKDYPQEGSNTYTQPWKSRATYDGAKRVADYLTDLNSRKKPHGAVPEMAAPLAPEYAAPPAEDYTEE